MFFGTSAFAVPSLLALAKSPHPVVAVVSRPDRPAGRGRADAASPVAAAAKSLGLELQKPHGPAEPGFSNWLSGRGADLGVVVAYGRLLPDAVLSIPRLGFVNVHASLLPRHRGASPIQAALLAGDETTGVSTLHVVSRLDAGDVILATEERVRGDDDAGALGERLAALGADLLVRTVESLASGTAPRTPQDESRATLCGKIGPDVERLDFSRPADEVVRVVRALAPRPGAYFQDPVGRVRVLRAERSEGETAAPGTVHSPDDPRGPRIACGEGSIRLVRVQPAGGNAMDGAAFARGRRWTPGTIVGAIKE